MNTTTKPTKSQHKRWSLRYSACLVLGAVALPALMGAPPLWAQPPARTGQEAIALANEWEALQKKMGAVETDEPGRAVAAYEEFLQARALNTDEVAVKVTSRIAQLYGRDLKDRVKALEIYDWALKRWGQTGFVDRLQRERDLMAHTGQADNADKSAGDKNKATVAPVPVAPVPVAPVPVAPVPVAPVPVAPVQPLTIKPVTPFGVPPKSGAATAGGVAPVGVKKAKASAEVAAVRVGALAVALQEIHDGRSGVQQAWLSGALTMDDAVKLLGQAGEWGVIDGRDDKPLRHDLAALIVRNDAPRLQELDKLPLRARLWIGDYLQKAGDERAITLLESVLTEFKEPKADQNPAAFQAIEILALYYRNRGQTEKAVQTWLRVEQMHDAQDWRVSDAMIASARIYSRAGQRDKADVLYARAKALPNKYFQSLAVFDRARDLMARGQHNLAQQLLIEALPLFDNHKEQITLLSQLSRSFYEEGDLEQALRYGERAVKQAKDVTWNLAKQEDAPLNMAREVVREVKSWQQSPIRLEPSALQVTLPKNRTSPIIKRLRVKTRGNVPFQVTSSSPAVQAHIIDESLTVATDSKSGREVVVQIMPEAAAKDVTLTFSSTRLAGNEAKVSVQLSAEN